jgi:hypothetical protein
MRMLPKVRGGITKVTIARRRNLTGQEQRSSDLNDTNRFYEHRRTTYTRGVTFTTDQIKGLIT